MESNLISIDDDGALEGHDWLRLLLVLGMATGCRRGELLALSRPNVDLELAVIKVSKSLAQTRTKGVFLKQPKGRKERRFSLPPFAIDALRAHRVKQDQHRKMFGDDYRLDLDLVFTTPDGNYLKHREEYSDLAAGETLVLGNARTTATGKKVAN